MDRWPELYEPIQEYYKLGHSIDETLSALCNDYDILPQSMETVNEWIKTLDDQKLMRHAIRYDYFELLNAITNRYLMFEKAIHFDKDYCPWHVIPCCSRYGYTEETNDEEETNIPMLEAIKFFDHFSAKERLFPLKDNPIRSHHTNCYFRPIPISDQYFLVFEATWSDDQLEHLYLLEIDWQKKQCILLNQMEMEFNNMRECFRNNEEGKFLILVDTPIDDENDETSIIYLGQVKDTKITVEKSEYKAKRWSNCRRYTQNKLIGIDEDYCNRDYTISFNYWDLDLLDGAKTDYQFECDFDLKAMKIYTSEHCWKDNFCYLVVSSDFNLFYSQIICFNLDTRRCSLLNYEIQTVLHRNCIINVDQDYVISFRCNNAAYRIPMRKPEPLQNLCWFNIQRRSLLSNKKYYKTAIERLPLSSEIRGFNDLKVLVPEKLFENYKNPSQFYSKFVLFALIFVYLNLIWWYFTYLDIDMNDFIGEFENLTLKICEI